MPTLSSLTTDRLGGVDVPSPEALLAMRAGNYILCARGGRLSRVPVEKSLLPHDPEINPPAIQCGVRWAPDGAVYAVLRRIVCRSIDGGRTWESHPSGGPVSCFDIVADGAFVAVRGLPAVPLCRPRDHVAGAGPYGSLVE